MSGKLGMLYQCIINIDGKLGGLVADIADHESRIRELKSIQDMAIGEKKQSRWDFRTILMLGLLFLTLLTVLIGFVRGIR
jgi:hypothetical protein